MFAFYVYRCSDREVQFQIGLFFRSRTRIDSSGEKKVLKNLRFKLSYQVVFEDHEIPKWSSEIQKLQFQFQLHKTLRPSINYAALEFDAHLWS